MAFPSKSFDQQLLLFNSGKGWAKLKGNNINQEYEYRHGLLLLNDTFHGMSREELNGGPIEGPCHKVCSRTQS